MTAQPRDTPPRPPTRAELLAPLLRMPPRAGLLSQPRRRSQRERVIASLRAHRH